MSRVELARRARKEILDLDWPLSDAVVEALGLLELEPQAGHLLRGRLRGLWSLRVGTYRIIYQVDDDQRLVRVLAVRHRPLLTRPIRAERQSPDRDLMRSYSSGRFEYQCLRPTPKPQLRGTARELSRRDPAVKGTKRERKLPEVGAPAGRPA